MRSRRDANLLAVREAEWAVKDESQEKRKRGGEEGKEVLVGDGSGLT